MPGSSLWLSSSFGHAAAKSPLATEAPASLKRTSAAAAESCANAGRLDTKSLATATSAKLRIMANLCDRTLKEVSPIVGYFRPFQSIGAEALPAGGGDAGDGDAGGDSAVGGAAGARGAPFGATL